MKECNGSAQQDLCFQSPLILKHIKNNPVTVMMAKPRLITLLRLEVCVLLLYWKIKQMFMGEKE